MKIPRLDEETLLQGAAKKSVGNPEGCERVARGRSEAQTSGSK
jgi:hypothetical protein